MMDAHAKIQEVLHDETGVGFMESLIAIIVGGLACIALISVSITVVREAKNNEIRDAMTYYLADGMQLVRIAASNDYGQITNDSLTGICDYASGSIPANAYLDTTNSPYKMSNPGIIPLSDPINPTDLCSLHDGSDCEKLPLPSNYEGAKMFYRELMFFPVDVHGCELVKVVVRVGMLANTAGNADARNFDTDVTLDGYITR